MISIMLADDWSQSVLLSLFSGSGLSSSPMVDFFKVIGNVFVKKGVFDRSVEKTKRIATPECYCSQGSRIQLIGPQKWL